MSDEPPRRTDPELSSITSSAGPSYDGMSYEVLRRYVSGESDEGERRRVAAWAAESAVRRKYLEALRRTWTRGGTAESEAGRSAATAWNALRAQLDVPSDAEPPFVAPGEAPVVEIDVRRRRQVRLLTHAFERRSRWVPVSVAAAALLVVGGTFLLDEGRFDGRSTPIPEREIVTGPGQRAEVKLGDGSAVTLASKSRLRFPVDFGARCGELILEGQAHFNVVHGTRCPFIVTAGGSRTVDIGTAFVVRAYPEDDGARVIVTEGEVAFGRDGGEAIPSMRLTAGRMGVLAAGARAPSVHSVDPSLYTGWLTGRLIFDNTSLADVANELSRWYDVQIGFADASLARETFTAKFTAESLSDALKTLTTVLHLRAERAGKRVILHRMD